MHEIKVASLSPEEASFGVTELRLNDALLAYTRYEDGDLMLRIEPSRDGGPVAIGFRGLTEALAEIDRILAPR